MNIDDSLMCLPVHLAACSKAVMLVGPTYLTRLWCVMEIFIHIVVVNDTTRLECIPVYESTEMTDLFLASEDFDVRNVVDMFSAFAVSESQCYSSVTWDKLISIIEAGCGTLDSFNALVQNIELTFLASTLEAAARKSENNEIVNTAEISEDIVKPDAIHAETNKLLKL
jgi:hypothetical protein